MKILLKIFGVFFAIVALLAAFISMFGWAVFFAVFAVLCFVVKPKSKKEKAAEEAAAADEFRRKLDSYDCQYFPVAGVTFKNDDGTPRQKILREICDGDEEGWARAELEAYTFEGEPAILVLAGDGCIGNIRRTDVAKVRPFLDRADAEVSVSIERFEDEDESRKIYRADVEIKVPKPEASE